MRILNNEPLRELPTFLVSGEVIGDSVMRYGVYSQQPEGVLQGEIPLSAMQEPAVPRALVGWFPQLAMAKEIGPMAISTGAVRMVPVGPAVKKPLNMIVDPVQQFLMSQLPLDETGTWVSLDCCQIRIEPMRGMANMVAGASAMSDMPEMKAPRREIVDSGVLKKLTATQLTRPFVQDVTPSPFESSVLFTLTGTTVDGTGTPIASCRVIAYQSGWRYVDNAPVVIAETVSDGSGVFSLSLRNIDYQLTAYKEGSPDKAGITRHDVTPVVVTTIYLRDPTAADSGGAGSGYSRGRVVNA